MKRVGLVVMIIGMVFLIGKHAWATEEEELLEALKMQNPVELELTRDPFAPLLGALYNYVTNVESGEFRLLGILYKEHAPLFLMETFEGIGVFKKGDTVGEYLVKNIEPQKVTLEKANKDFIFELGDENAK
ncbi:MAG: hypothetical protein KBA46_00665 [Candidatus Omnitrophica bacterium]|nr:hypothetical protein [Candidatus Omnitrophota bacterium]